MAGYMNRIADALGLATKDEVAKARRDGFISGFNEASTYDAYNPNDDPASGDIAKGGYGYSRVTSKSLRDFSKIPRDQLIETVYTMLQSNPVVKRYFQLKTSYILGRSVTVSSEDEKTQEVIDDFWQRNNLQQRLRDFVFSLYLWGEQLYPAFVRESDGSVKIGYIDPGELDASMTKNGHGGIVTNSENVLERIATVMDMGNGLKRVYRIIRPDDEGNLDTAAQLKEYTPQEQDLLKSCGLSEFSGDIFYFPVNNLPNQPRGYTDILSVIDWLDQLDRVLFGLADREFFAAMFLWHIKLIGLRDEELQEKRAAMRRELPNKTGQAMITNENVEATALTPDLKQTQSIATVDALVNFILGGLGIPRHWFGYGNDTNRSTAEAQGDPSWKTLQENQDEVRHVIRFIVDFVIYQYSLANPGFTPGEYVVNMPEMTTDDVGRLTQAISTLAQSIALAVEQDLITIDKGRELFAKVAAELGVEIDPAAEAEAIAAAQADNEIGQEQQRNDMLNELLGLGVQGEESRIIEGMDYYELKRYFKEKYGIDITTKINEKVEGVDRLIDSRVDYVTGGQKEQNGNV